MQLSCFFQRPQKGQLASSPKGGGELCSLVTKKLELDNVTKTPYLDCPMNRNSVAYRGGQRRAASGGFQNPARPSTPSGGSYPALGVGNASPGPIQASNDNAARTGGMGRSPRWLGRAFGLSGAVGAARQLQQYAELAADTIIAAKFIFWKFEYSNFSVSCGGAGVKISTLAPNCGGIGVSVGEYGANASQDPVLAGPPAVGSTPTLFGGWGPLIRPNTPSPHDGSVTTTYRRLAQTRWARDFVGAQYAEPDRRVYPWYDPFPSPLEVPYPARKPYVAPSPWAVPATSPRSRPLPRSRPVERPAELPRGVPAPRSRPVPRPRSRPRPNVDPHVTPPGLPQPDGTPPVSTPRDRPTNPWRPDTEQTHTGQPRAPTALRPFPRPFPRRPRKGEKERKVRVSKALLALMEATEYVDAIDVMWRVGFDQDLYGWTGNRTQRAKDLYTHWQSLDIEAAVIAVIENEIQDKIIGTLSKGQSRMLDTQADLAGGRSGAFSLPSF